ncbi:carbohydrate-binding module family 50 protein [Amniculicola lignicola CBS 123094]|uniref:Carbohydrate-binding module family 50 protein n=1 Tax=Amniculicola lignicola CBS 123094 TaxID=1392246 RepID=A0A6A5WQB8_9PLEO|nr:carbohydrate-binding module family 50 protein [Amniculicola lignicola CBS 123094]
MKKIQLDIGEPLGTHDSFTPTEFNSMKQSCGIPTSSYPVKTTTPATPAPSPTCTSKVTGKKGDTANTIAKANSVSTDRLLEQNSHLPASSNDTLVGGEVICFDLVQKCVIRQIVDGDSCGALTKAAGKGVDVVMLQSWNPTIGAECRNVKAMVGKYICISPPGTTALFTPIEGTPKPTITANATTEINWSFGSVPNTATNSKNFTTAWNFPTDPITISTVSKPLPPNTAASTAIARASNCPFLDENSPDWQAGLADDEYHLRSEDLPAECISSWDPYCLPAITGSALPSPTNIASSCYPTITTLIPDGFVTPPKPTQSGASINCNKWHVVAAGDSCTGIESKYKITHANFRLWNPAVNAGCTNIITEMAYCVRIWVEPVVTPTATIPAAPPGPTQSGASPTCTKWHLDKQGDTCDSIATLYGILVSRFRQLNRGVNTACSNLVVGNAYCVG